jgi:hypothetical protein
LLKYLYLSIKKKPEFIKDMLKYVLNTFPDLPDKKGYKFPKIVSEIISIEDNYIIESFFVKKVF